MNKVHNIYNYKKAKHVIKDLEQMLKVINISILGLSPYSKYKMTAYLMRILLEERKELEKHITTCKKIIEVKGRIDG